MTGGGRLILVILLGADRVVGAGGAVGKGDSSKTGAEDG